MRQLLDLDRFPLGEPDGASGEALLARCRSELRQDGMFSLSGLIRPEALRRCVAEVEPVLESSAFTHSREHNIYFYYESPDVSFSNAERLGFYGRTGG